MPQIPNVPTLQPVNQPYVSPAEAGRPGETVARLGQEGEQIAQVGSEFSQRLIDAQVQTDVKWGQISLEQLQGELHQALSKAVTPEQVDESIENYRKQAQDAMAPYSKDPRADRALQMHAAYEDVRMQDVGSVKKADIITKSDAAANTALGVKYKDEGIKERLAGGDGSKAEGQYELVLQSSVAHGTLLPVVADAKLQAWRQDVQVGAIEARINDPNPAQRQELINNLKSGKGPLVDGLPEAIRNPMLTAAESRNRELTNLSAAQDVNTNFGNLLGYFKENQTLFADPESKVAATTNPEVLKAIGVVTPEGQPDFVAGKKLREYVEPMVADEKRVAAEKATKAEKEVSDAMTEHEWGKAKQILHKNLPLLPGLKGEELDKAITARAKRTDADISNGEDGREFGRIRDMDPADPETEKQITVNPNLKDGSRKSLYEWVDMAKDKVLKAGLAAGGKLLHSQIAPAKSDFELAGPRHQAKSADAQQALSDWVKGENDKARKGSRKPLTEAEIYQHAKEMLPQYRATAAEDVEDMREQARDISDAIKDEKKAAKSAPKEGTVKTNKSGDKVKLTGGKWVLVP